MRISRLVGAALHMVACAETPRGPLPAWMEERVEDVSDALDGDVSAMHRLCFDLVYGKRGLPQDGFQARVWCAAAAERDEPSAQTLYAQLLASGQGGPVDLAAALRWYTAAASQGHEHATYILGLMYRDGRGVESDSAAADSILGLARAMGYDSLAAANQSRR